MTIQTENDLLALRHIGGIVANCLQLMGKSIEPGMTTLELDAIGDAYLTAHGAQSAPRVTYQFPGATCISVNHEIAHGIPGKRRILAGDLVNIDVSAELNGYFADTGGSFMVPPFNNMKQRLCRATKQALSAAMSNARDGMALNMIGKAIEQTAQQTGFSILRNLGSHGVGRGLHEEPEFIAPYFDPSDRRQLKEGMVITIEPFLSTGAQHAKQSRDGWTLFTAPQFLSAQYEHTMVITKGQPMIMTLPT